MLMVKIGQLSIVYNRTLGHAMTKNDVISEKGAFSFSEWIGLLKTLEGENDG